MKYIKIEDKNLIRDISNMSLINNDKDELDEYLNRRNFLLRQKEEINTMQEQINDLKNDISEIKQLLIKNLKV